MKDVFWISSVRSTGTLTIDASAVHGPAWKPAVAAAIRELNALFNTESVNVTLQASESAVVKVALTSGKYTFPVDGKTESGTLPTNILQGVTRGIDRQAGSNINREQAFIFLPLNPKVKAGTSKSRDVGEPVMRVMIAHEFIHALGLNAHDPAFSGLLTETWTLNEGKKPAGDTLTPFGGSATLPPVVLSKNTVTRLRALWP